MQTFLWHPLTPKCTWPSQNKSKKTLRKYWENFFRNYAPFYIQGGGGGHNYGNYCTILAIQKDIVERAGEPWVFSWFIDISGAKYINLGIRMARYIHFIFQISTSRKGPSLLLVLAVTSHSRVIKPLILLIMRRKLGEWVSVTPVCGNIPYRFM